MRIPSTPDTLWLSLPVTASATPVKQAPAPVERDYRVNFQFSKPGDDYWAYHQRYAWTVVKATCWVDAQAKVRQAVKQQGNFFRGLLGGDSFRFTPSQHPFVNLGLSDFTLSE